MGSRTLTHTFTGSETLWSVFASGSLPAFTGTATITGTCTGLGSTTQQFTMRLVNSASTTCYQTTVGFLGGATTAGPFNITVGIPSGSWSCTNWVLWSLEVYTNQYVNPPVGTTVTVTITGAGIPDPSPCAYGTQPATTAGAVTIITEFLVATVVTALGAPWLEALFAPLIGWALDTGILCGTGPPAMPAITPQTLLADVQSKLAFLEAAAWYSICQCIPATGSNPPPIPYTPPTLTQPTGWPPPAGYTCSNSDICTTLQLVLKRLDQLSTSQSIRVDQTTNVLPGGAGVRYKAGTVHSGLTGSGNITVSDCIGFRIELTAGTPEATRPGNPTYLWDVGWASINDGGAMLQETRVTRSSYEWFPVAATLGTSFGYFANPGLTLQMTELLPVS
jgi:hypothetical protein